MTNSTIQGGVLQIYLEFTSSDSKFKEYKMDNSRNVKVKQQEPTTMKQSNTCQKTKVFRIASFVRRRATDIVGACPKSHEYMYK
jgi:hypothetical protein